MITPTPMFYATVSDTALQAHFAKLPPRLRENLRKTIADLTQEMLGRVLAAEPVRTGYLRSQTRSYVDSTEDFVRGRVRVLATGRASRAGAAFGALEYGVPLQAVSVRAYARRGLPVRAYQRTTEIAARRFLRGSLDAMRSKAVAKITETVDRTVKEFNAP
jgi:hypothetical protein